MDLIQCTKAQLRDIVVAARAAALKDVFQGTKTTNPAGYYSTVRFAGRRSGVSPNYVVTVEATERVAFSYGVGGDMSGAGYPAGTQATVRQTNQSKPNETRNGETFYALGMCLYLSQMSDSLLAKAVWQNAWLELVTNGSSFARLGPLDFIPARSGLWGVGDSALVEPALQNPSGQAFSFANSNEDSECYFAFPQDSPIVWMPSGKTDSSVNLAVKLARPITFQGLADRAAAAGVAEYNVPEETFCDLTFQLVGFSLADISTNASG